MKVLLLSDSHGCSSRLQDVLRKENDCPMVIFLGDGLRDVERVRDVFPNKKFICVSGNNDWNAAGNYEDFAYQYLEGHTLIATHGHRAAVRYTLHELAAKANAVRADVALFGHTHKPLQQLADGVLCINPGALCNGQYAVLDISAKDVKTTFLQDTSSDT